MLICYAYWMMGEEREHKTLDYRHDSSSYTPSLQPYKNNIVINSNNASIARGVIEKLKLCFRIWCRTKFQAVCWFLIWSWNPLKLALHILTGRKPNHKPYIQIVSVALSYLGQICWPGRATLDKRADAAQVWTTGRVWGPCQEWSSWQVAWLSGVNVTQEV